MQVILSSKRRAIVRYSVGATPVGGIVDGEDNVENFRSDPDAIISWTTYVNITEIKRAIINFGGERGDISENVVRVEGRKSWYFADDFLIF